MKPGIELTLQQQQEMVVALRSSLASAHGGSVRLIVQSSCADPLVWDQLRPE